MKIKTYALTFLLLAQTLLYQVSLPQLVLCIGDDGHVAIEEAMTDSVCFIHPPAARSPEYATALLQDIHPDTGPCVDIFLDWHLSMAQYKQDTKLAKKMPSMVISQTLPTEYSTKLNIINSDEQSAIHTSGTLIARSIILLI